MYYQVLWSLNTQLAYWSICDSTIGSTFESSEIRIYPKNFVFIQSYSKICSHIYYPNLRWIVIYLRVAYEPTLTVLVTYICIVILPNGDQKLRKIKPTHININYFFHSLLCVFIFFYSLLFENVVRLYLEVQNWPFCVICLNNQDNSLLIPDCDF